MTKKKLEKKTLKKEKTHKKITKYANKISNKAVVKEKESLSYNVLLKRNNDYNQNIFSEKFFELPCDSQPIVIIGDVFEKIKKIPSKSISLIVTSPPYWNLRDYNANDQIGRESDPRIYVNKMVELSVEFLRILKDDGGYFLNIGDTYVDQNLQMIPQRIAIGMQEKGWLLRNQIIWYKPDHMPSPVKSRFKNTYEPIYFFTKNDWEKKVYFNIDQIRIPHKTEQLEIKIPSNDYRGKFKGNEKNIGASPGGRISVNGVKYVTKRMITSPQEIICDYLRYWRDKRGFSNQDIVSHFGKSYEHTVGHWFRKDAGGSYPSIDDWMKLKELLKFDSKHDLEMIETEEVLQAVINHPKGKNPGDVIDADMIPDFLKINTAKSQYEHFAIFPKKIPELAIKACCPENGIVLDPFAGSGTTGKAALELKRKSILIELQEDFLEIIKERCGNITIIKGN